MRGTHIYSSTDCPTHPLHYLRSAPARRQRARPPRTTVAKLYQQELDSLPPTPDNTSEIFLENFRKKYKKNINLAVCVMIYKKSGLQEQKLKDVEKKRDLVCGWDQVGPS